MLVTVLNICSGENVSRRQAFPLEAGKKTAAVYAESFELRDFSHGSLHAVSQWFKDNIHVILQEYAPNHPIQKEDVFLGTCISTSTSLV
jgi:abelson tyrosine-protein kinase 1/abelson tyrosine-protein kinase 2